MRRAAVILGAAAAFASARPAAAGPIGMGMDASELYKREVSTIHGPIVTGTAGFHGDIAAFAELKFGYGYGKHIDQFLFDEYNLWRGSFAVRGALGKTDSLSVAALAGYGTVSLVGLVVEAGVDARLSGENNLGPIVAATARLGPIGIGAQGWVHVLEEERDWGWTVGLSWTWGDY